MIRMESQYIHIEIENGSRRETGATIVWVKPGGPPQSPDRELPEAMQGLLAEWTASGRFSAAFKETAVCPTLGLMSEPALLFTGLGQERLTPSAARELAGALVKAGRKEKLTVLHADCSMLLQELEELQLLQRFVEGAVLASYRVKKYNAHTNADQQHDEETRPMRTLRLSGFRAPEQQLLDAAARGAALAESTLYARDLTNMPGNLMSPELLAREAEVLASAYGFTCELLGPERLAELGMGGLLAVGGGSSRPPYMAVLHYRGDSASTHVDAIVGKGITFDTGGISIKPAKGMEEMISDMGGAAAVLGAMRTIGELRPKRNIMAVIPCAENMPSGDAYRPGDVITAFGGKTIEVLNTDAEGRIILADAVGYAQHLGASRIVEVSTLTGAVLVCFADVVTGALSNDDALYAELQAASEKAGERIWRLPAYSEFRDKLKSDVAYIKNHAGSHGAAIIAGAFIGAFMEKVPWVHLDIGGTSWLYAERGLESKYGTGVMTRTLAEWLMIPFHAQGGNEQDE